ncbi:hypothetical protein WG904_04535 [Pedobacter sp. Du54]|uniref:hypothetical protein n=1 Tax=Pedobacter anseongensis TaxID=3133439 RepID=UPI0030ABD4CE
MIYSCKRDIGNLFSGDEEPNDIAWAKDYYARNLEKKNNFAIKLGNTKGTTTVTELKSNKKTPIWAKSSQGKTGLYTFVEVPLKYEHKVSPTLMITKNPLQTPVADQEIIDASFDRLVIYKDVNEKINQRIISFIPDIDYLRRHKNNIEHNRIDRIDNDFNGYLHYKDWDGKALFILRIENGKPVKKYDMSNSLQGKLPNVSATQKASEGKVMVLPPPDGYNCYFLEWDWYQDCYYANEQSTTPISCDPIVVYNVHYIQIDCPPPPGGDGDGGPSPDPYPEPECLGILLLETGECIEDPVTPCDFVREAAKNPAFKIRMDSLAANVSGNTEKAYAINYSTHYVQYEEGAVNDPYVSLGIGASIDFYGHNHFGSGLPIFSEHDMQVLYKLDSAGLINNYQSFTFTLATSYGQYVLSIENKTQFQSFLSNNFSSNTAFETWSFSYQDLAAANISTFNKPAGEAWELAFLQKIAGNGIKLFKKDAFGIFMPIKKDSFTLSIINDFCN